MSTNLRKIAVLCTSSGGRSIDEKKISQGAVVVAYNCCYISCSTSVVLRAMDPGVNITLCLPSIPYR